LDVPDIRSAAAGALNYRICAAGTATTKYQ
jgi:hypothetical protein